MILFSRSLVAAMLCGSNHYKLVRAVSSRPVSLMNRNATNSLFFCGNSHPSKHRKQRFFLLTTLSITTNCQLFAPGGGCEVMEIQNYSFKSRRGSSFPTPDSFKMEAKSSDRSLSQNTSIDGSQVDARLRSSGVAKLSFKPEMSVPVRIRSDSPEKLPFDGNPETMGDSRLGEPRKTSESPVTLPDWLRTLWKRPSPARSRSSPNSSAVWDMGGNEVDEEVRPRLRGSSRPGGGPNMLFSGAY